MAKFKGTTVVDIERCKGCGLCVVACPLNVLALSAKCVNQKGYPFAQEILDNTCIGCAACATVCPDGCITVYRTKAE
ncbi:MAG: 4Fe-4S binding protein [Bacteroidaceae bacterium]|nr:4Fe-4S binding protein [Bacteroidaceae bacterium]